MNQLLVVLLASASGCAAQPSRAYDQVITNSPRDNFPDIGTKGVDSDTELHRKLILTPTLDSSTSSHVKIPMTIQGALDELTKALPNSYVRSLKLSGSKERVTCTSSDPALDEEIESWLITFWNLDDPNNPLLDELHITGNGELFPRAAASTILYKFCMDRRIK